MSEKRVYTFGNGVAEGKADMRNLLGGKGANLAEMNLIGVPVPPGFTITTDVCNEYFEKGKEKVVSLLKGEVEKAVQHIEGLMNSKFGDVNNPLLVSVRSGARASMPGMMDTTKGGQRAFRLRQLPSLRANVWRRGAGNEAHKQGRHRSIRRDYTAG